ncbi:MAG: hypothetical protein WB791_01535 [Waddliaceae bacterium]
MDISIFLAKLMGFYLVIGGLAYFLKRPFLREVIEDFYNSPGLVMVASAMNLILGLLVVLNHNIWELSWKVIITIIGYLVLFKGIFHLFFPEWAKKLSEKYSKADIFVYSGVISLALGIYLLYYAYADSFQETHVSFLQRAFLLR